MLLRKFHLLVCMICGMALQAQTYHIDGFIKDSFTKEKIDSAQIALLNPEDSTVVEEFLGIKHGWWQCYRNIQKPGKYISTSPKVLPVLRYFVYLKSTFL